MSQIDNMVRSINLKYPELAKNIEIPPDFSYNPDDYRSYESQMFRLFNVNNNTRNILA